LKVLGNVLKLGKIQDSTQDITKSSSLPTLMIAQLRNILKSDQIDSSSELTGDLI